MDLDSYENFSNVLLTQPTTISLRKRTITVQATHNPHCLRNQCVCKALNSTNDENNHSTNVGVLHAEAPRPSVTMRNIAAAGWRLHSETGGVTARVAARDAKGRVFDFHFQLTTLGKLFTHVRLCHQAV